MDDFRDRWTPSLGAKATNEAVDLLCTGGVERVSLNKLADAADYSPAYFHKLVHGRAGLIGIVVGHFADRWVRRVTGRPDDDNVVAWLPDSAGAIDGVRCWHAMIELAHGEARAGRLGPAKTIAVLHAEEQMFLYRSASGPLARRPTGDELLIVQMVLHGMRAAMAAPDSPLPIESARAALRRLFEALRAEPAASDEEGDTAASE